MDDEELTDELLDTVRALGRENKPLEELGLDKARNDKLAQRCKELAAALRGRRDW